MFSDFIILHLVAIRKGIIVLLDTCVAARFHNSCMRRIILQNFKHESKSPLIRSLNVWTYHLWIYIPGVGDYSDSELSPQDQRRRFTEPEMLTLAHVKPPSDGEGGHPVTLCKTQLLI